MTSIPLQTLRDVQRPTHTIHLYHANGFPPICYRGLAKALPDSYRVVAIPTRPLWEPTPPIEEFDSWELMADDLLAGLDQHELDQVIGVGHSMGGTSTIIASIKQPQRFKALILLDPTLLPPTILWGLRLIQWVPGLELPLVRAARTRKRTWESAEAAFQRYRGRAIFARWSDEALRDYIESISQPVEASNGSRHLALTYPPDWEARIYETIPYDCWSYVPQISVPTLVIRGADTNTFTGRSAQQWNTLRPDIDIIEVPNTTHFLPMEAPERVARHIHQFIENLS